MVTESVWFGVKVKVMWLGVPLGFRAKDVGTNQDEIPSGVAMADQTRSGGPGTWTSTETERRPEGPTWTGNGLLETFGRQVAY